MTKFITNRLFGRGRRWNGKSFDAVTTTTSTTSRNFSSNDDNNDAIRSDGLTGTGWNQFDVLRQYRTPAIHRRHTSTKSSTSSSTTVILKTEREHVFDYRMEPSRLHPHDLSICLDYQNHQGILSLWKGMKDELRVLPTTTSSISPTATTVDENNMNRQKYDILIGLGSLSWSGGIYNGSPFCLYRRRK